MQPNVCKANGKEEVLTKQGIDTRQYELLVLCVERTRLRAEDNLEIRLTLVAYGVGRRSLIDLVRSSPALARRAIPREARFRRAGSITADGVRTNANIAIAAFHHGEVVSGALFASVGAVAEFKESLRAPLAAGAPFGMSGQAHTLRVEGRVDNCGLTGRDVSGLRLLQHLEKGLDLVERDLLGPLALVDHVEPECIRTTVSAWRASFQG